MSLRLLLSYRTPRVSFYANPVIQLISFRSTLELLDDHLGAAGVRRHRLRRRLRQRARHHRRRHQPGSKLLH